MPKDQRRRLFSNHKRHVNHVAQTTQAPTEIVVMIHQAGCGRKEILHRVANTTTVTVDAIQTLAIELLADSERLLTR